MPRTAPLGTGSDRSFAPSETRSAGTKLKTLGEEYTKTRGDLQKEYGVATGGRPAPGATPPAADKMAEYTKKNTALSTETMDKAKKELTDDQKKAWTELTGAAFDVAKLTARPMRRDN